MTSATKMPQMMGVGSLPFTMSVVFGVGCGGMGRGVGEPSISARIHPQPRQLRSSLALVLPQQGHFHCCWPPTLSILSSPSAVMRILLPG